MDCKIDGCKKPAFARGMCSMHYARQKRHGDPLKGAAPPRWGEFKRHELHHTWLNIIQRCENPKSRGFKAYGGRGIKVCVEWRHDFWQFVTDVGPRPSKAHTLDRIDNNGDYEPLNVRWATHEEQSANRRTSRFSIQQKAEVERLYAEIGNKAEISRRVGIPYEAVLHILPPKPKPERTRDSHHLPFGTRPARYCSYEGCKTVHYGNGYCRKHYRWIYESKSWRDFQERGCEQCGSKFQQNVRIDTRFCSTPCKMKWHRQKGCYTAEALAGARKCSVEGCDRPHQAKGLCRRHFMQKWHADNPAKPHAIGS